MSKITSINQTGGIIAEEVSLRGENYLDINWKEITEETRKIAIATLKSEGYIVFSKEQWDNFKFLMKNEYDVLGFYIETAVMEVLP